jgi:two-component system alkaline phosphatase synthesis response regulator PhoP
MPERPLVLIVDDDSEILNLYAYTLQNAGFEVITAENGLRAIEAAKGPRRPDIILMDVQMPVMDGAQAFMGLKEEPTTKGIKVVFMTAFTDLRESEIDAKLAEEIGASGFIKKDINIDELAVRVKQALQ